jgi:hypothetical protein
VNLTIAAQGLETRPDQESTRKAATDKPKELVDELLRKDN